MIQTPPRNPNTPLVTHVWEQILSKDNIQLCLQVNHNFSLLKQRLDSSYVLVSTLFFFFFTEKHSITSISGSRALCTGSTTSWPTNKRWTVLSSGSLHCSRDPHPYCIHFVPSLLFLEFEIPNKLVAQDTGWWIAGG